LTVAETLYYAAELRLPKDFTVDQKAQRVEECLQLMKITHIKNVKIGDSRHKGVSGGERKRVCIAVELLSKPKLLFLDEPTSGIIILIFLNIFIIIILLLHHMLNFFNNIVIQ
jgi:ATP-binding cassette subfamily G (WHITE) protein 2